jgi:hypothetical protein
MRASRRTKGRRRGATGSEGRMAIMSESLDLTRLRLAMIIMQCVLRA